MRAVAQAREESGASDEAFGIEARGVFPITNAVAARYPPVATWTLVAINCAVFLLQLSLGPGELEQFPSTYAVIAARYFYPDASPTVRRISCRSLP